MVVAACQGQALRRLICEPVGWRAHESVGLGAYQASGRMGKAVPLRLRRGADPMSGLENVGQENGSTQEGAILGAPARERHTP
jgi:hypothetical protein